jgi:hypothetical protein
MGETAMCSSYLCQRARIDCKLGFHLTGQIGNLSYEIADSRTVV